MPVTVAEAIERVSRRYDDASENAILDYFNEADRELKVMLPMSEDTEDLTLVAGQSEYALDENILTVESAEFQRSATDIRQLRGVDKRQLPGGFRHETTGDPTRFYLAYNASTMVIGLVPAPSAATSGTYPRVRLYVSRSGTLTALGNLPYAVNADYYVFYANWRLSLDRKLDDSNFWKEQFVEARKSEIAINWARNKQDPPSITPPFGGMTPV